MKILFVLGSPTGNRGSSTMVAQYVAAFVDKSIEVDFLMLKDYSLHTAPEGEGDDSLEEILRRMQDASAVVWVFGAYALGPPAKLVLLFGRLLDGNPTKALSRKLACSIMTSVKYMDDRLLQRVRWVSEQLGFGYLDDISVIGNPVLGYEDELVTEELGRRLADRLSWAVINNRMPSASMPRWQERHGGRSTGHGEGHTGGPSQADVSPFGDQAQVALQKSSAGDDHSDGQSQQAGPLVVLCATPPGGSRRLEAVVGRLRRAAVRPVEVMDLAHLNLLPCTGCFLCNFKQSGQCHLKDDYNTVLEKLGRATMVVMVSTSQSVLPEYPFKCLNERLWGILHRPIFFQAYCSTLVLGGGSPMAPWLANDLGNILQLSGMALVTTASDVGWDWQAEEPALQVGRMIDELERAVGEKWTMPMRFFGLSSRTAFRELALRHGYMLRADYHYHKKHGLLSVKGRLGGLIPRFLFSFPKLNRLLCSLGRRRAMQKRLFRFSQWQSKKEMAYLPPWVQKESLKAD